MQCSIILRKLNISVWSAVWNIAIHAHEEDKKCILNFGGETLLENLQLQIPKRYYKITTGLQKTGCEDGRKEMVQDSVPAALNLRNVLQYNEFINWTI
jgi:hypothetical protein